MSWALLSCSVTSMVAVSCGLSIDCSRARREEHTQRHCSHASKIYVSALKSVPRWGAALRDPWLTGYTYLETAMATRPRSPSARRTRQLLASASHAYA